MVLATVPTLHHMTRPGSILRGVQIYFVLARVRIWVISTVIAPNKHISCKSCSSRTRPSVTATMIVIRCRFRRQPVVLSNPLFLLAVYCTLCGRQTFVWNEAVREGNAHAVGVDTPKWLVRFSARALWQGRWRASKWTACPQRNASHETRHNHGPRPDKPPAQRRAKRPQQIKQHFARTSGGKRNHHHNLCVCVCVCVCVAVCLPKHQPHAVRF